MNTVSLTYIYFFYGLAFFAMGLAVLLEVGRTSELRFARSLPWLAAFGLVHGGHEWIEMFEAIGYLPDWLSLDALRTVLLVVSLTCLAAFGLSLMSKPEHVGRAMWRTLALLGVCLSGMGLLRFWFPPAEWIVIASVWVRYSLGIVGAIITSWALVAQSRAFAAGGMERFGRDLAWAAVAFALYGVVGQVFVPATALPPSNWINADLFVRLTGVPIQLFRGAMAVIVATAILRALRVFEIERSQQLRAAQQAALEAERRVQLETAQLNRQLQEAVNEISTLFEMSRILAATLDLDTLLQQAVKKVVDLLPANAAMILLDASPATPIAAAIGFDETSQAAAQVIGWDAMEAAQAGSPNVYEDNEFKMLGVPLQTTRRLVGSLVIHVSDVRAFDPRHSLLITLGRELGTAIENAQLYLQVQERQALRGDLLRKSVEVQEEERKRIARELHDGIGQIFTALALGLSGVEEAMVRDPQLARRQAGNLKELAIRAIAEMRQLVSDLRPPQLDDLGLVPALHWLADEWRDRRQLNARVEINGARHRLTSEMETVLFRIAQEALTNIAKHAQAQHASVNLSFEPDAVELRVQDDGIGMTPEQINRRLARHQGWGLAGIQERAALVGGQVEITSAPGHGTRLTVRIPLKAPEAIA